MLDYIFNLYSVTKYKLPPVSIFIQDVLYLVTLYKISLIDTLSIVVEHISYILHYIRYFAASIVSILVLFTIPWELPLATKYVTILV